MSYTSISAHLCDLQSANEVDLNVFAEFFYRLVHKRAMKGSACVVDQGRQGVATEKLPDLHETGEQCGKVGLREAPALSITTF